MRCLTPFLCLLATLAPTLHAQSDDAFTQPDAILRTLDRVYAWQAANLVAHNNQSIIGWKHATFYTAVMQLYKATGHPKYRDLLTTISTQHDWTMLEVNQALWRHADNHLIGETFINLFMEEAQPERIAHVTAIFNRMRAEPWSGRRLYKWCDALFMSPPVWAQLAAVYDDSAFLTELDRLWWDATDFLFDPQWSLFYRDASYFDAVEANGKPVFWGRGNGWVIGGLTRILDYLPKDYPGRKAYVDLFQNMATQLAALQMPSGGWSSSLLFPERFDFQTEMSATAFFVYGIAWGINNGLLDRATFGPIATNGWREMQNFINRDGTIAHIQIVGKEPGPVDDGADGREYGYGAVIMAGLQMAAFFESAPAPSWGGFPVVSDGTSQWANSGDFLGWLEVSASPFVFSPILNRYIYVANPDAIADAGAWLFVPRR